MVLFLIEWMSVGNDCVWGINCIISFYMVFNDASPSHLSKWDGNPAFSPHPSFLYPSRPSPLLFCFHLYFIWPEGSSGRTPSASWEWGVLVVQALFKPMSPASSPWGRGPTRESPEMRESVSGALGDVLAATALLASPKPTFRELWFNPRRVMPRRRINY